MRLRSLLLAFTTFLFVAALAIGCDSVDDSAGRVIVRMTDAPIDNVTEINVTIEACEIINSATDERETITSSDDATSFNLLAYAGGATLDVCDQEVQLSTFDQLRIVVGDEASIRIGEDPPEDLHVASGSSSGLKFFFDEPVTLGGETLDVTLDFVADESVHATGPLDSPGYIMTPVIRVVTATVATQDVGLTDEEVVSQEAQ